VSETDITAYGFMDFMVLNKVKVFWRADEDIAFLCKGVHYVVVYGRGSSYKRGKNFKGFVVCHALSIQRFNYNVNTSCKAMEGEIINYNYVGSIAERKMHFASSVEVIIDEKNELFNAISIYVPASLAAANIVDWDPAWASADRPAVFTCVLNNYKEIMKGKLLDQWQDVFRMDTNVSVILYLVVFQDDNSTAAMWEIDDASIKFKPLTDAFNKLFHISYPKMLFDEDYDGRPVQLPSVPGTAASAQVRFSNQTGADVSLPADTYMFNDGVKDWVIPVPDAVVIPAGSGQTLGAAATTVGDNAALTVGPMTLGDISPAVPIELTVNVLAVTQGTNPSQGPITVPSKFFDLSLCLAYLCKLNVQLSYFINMVKISYVDQQPNPNDNCWIRLKTSAEEKEAMLSIISGDRTKYYWGALFLMNCVLNTWTLAHSEPVNIIPLIFAAWFGLRNSSGQYVGNKLSMLRLRGTRIKPLGFPSWLNSEINENDAKGFDLLDAKNVGYLCTISDNTPQESCVSSARSISGMPVAALMISKFVDYTSSQQCARLLTDSETLTNPVLTNEEAYTQIQDILFKNLLLFTGTKRISNVQLKFPPFPMAKVSLRALVATGSWEASYTDDLDEVTVTGGITAA